MIFLAVAAAAILPILVVLPALIIRPLPDEDRHRPGPAARRALAAGPPPQPSFLASFKIAGPPHCDQCGRALPPCYDVDPSAVEPCPHCTDQGAGQ